MEAGGATAGAGGKEARPLTAEEEAVKRNTDCVYFLASPLTCKKGNECDYRHSEGARVNPRDCYYWLNGNCMNPKCLFRHPPLDGPIGVSGTTLVPVLPSQTKSASQIHALHAAASHNINKQGVPCYFFQKGQCLKGDRCAFMHGPQSIGPQPTVTPVPQQVTKISAPIAEHPSTVKKESWGLKECTKQNLPEVGMKKPVEALPLSAKPTSRTESIPTYGLTLKQSSSPYPLEDEIPRYLPANVPIGSGVAANLTRSHQSQPADVRLQNGRDADEFLGESSPGFDVLVDDIEGSDYLPKDNDFGRETVQGGRSLYPVTDFNYHHSDYEPVPNLERDRFNGKDYNHYGRVHSQQSREQRRTSSERIGDRILMPVKKGMRREKSPDEIDRRDLRHRLSKQRRLDGPRSAVDAHRRGEPYRRDDRYVEGEGYRGRHSHRDQQHVPQEISISARLQGRIKLPARSSPERLSEKERDRERHRGRLSLPRSTDVQGRHHDRMKRRLHDDLPTDARNLKEPARRDEPDSLDFAGPKSLAELKGRKVSESSQGQSTRSINIELPEQKRMKSGSQESEGSDEFASPKPLNDMLKRKRETASENGAISSNRDGDNHRGESDAELPSATEHRAIVEEEEEGLIHEDGEVGLYTDQFSPEALEEGTTVEEKDEEGLIHEVEVGLPQAKYKVGTRMQVDSSDEFIHSPEDVVKGNNTAYSMEEPELRAVEEVEEEGSIREVEVDQSQVKYTVEMEEGRIMDTTEDREVVSSDQRNEESDYEAFEAGDLTLEDDENMYQAYEDELGDDGDDDDEDDFARKVGVLS